MTFRIDEAGNQALMEAVAYGFHNYAEAMADTIRQLAPAHRSRRKVAYRSTIQASTWLNGQRIAGRDVKVTGYSGRSAGQAAFDRSRLGRAASIRSIVYTTSSLGHLLEFGTQAHLIPVPAGLGRYGTHSLRRIHHPGAGRRPHFTPGFLASLAMAGPKIAQGAQGRGVRARVSGMTR